ncbi:nitroreductase [Shewanella psychropiezotolerans]|uniref:Nitroreductase n=1 Tax=Shewanella psychropiezotolerans TaxID=2593655 RepID=A0ABX5WXW9_9GAMM|nr:nitroreductase family protein [Shewanella psychropiezotolerans]QDO83951.1 nitroreductase [Shewanella psychropiezotolerans]
MTNSHHNRKSDIIYAALGANERDIVDKIKLPWLRRFLIRFVGVKLRLQFTGWLQYLMPVPIVLGLYIMSGLLYLLLPSVATIFVLLPTLLLAIILFDIVTTRLRIRLPEPLPKSNEESDVFSLMRNRRSCRSYQTRPLTDEHEQALLESVTRHLKEPKFSESNIRLEWVHAPLTIWPVVNARHFLIAIAPAKYDRKAVLDIGKTLQKVVIDVTRMGLGSCWIGPGADHNSVKSVLNERFDENKDAIICVCAIGYKSWYTPLFIRIFNAQFHKRLPLESLFFSDNDLTQPLKTTGESFIQYERCFESCQWSPSSYNGQTTRCVGTQIADDQLRVDFYAATSSRYYAAVATGIWCANWEMGCDELGQGGSFRILSTTERGISAPQNVNELPHYDVSWISKDTLPAG